MIVPQRFCINFNDGWKFFPGDGAFAESSFDDRAWKPLTLPHDWGMDYPVEEKAPTGGGGGYAVAGIGWYRKRFVVPPEGAGKRILIRFDGIFMDSTVYINGKKAGGRIYGYSSFTVDITGFLRSGENILAVRVNNSLQPNSRWYTGSGIYRNVWLSAVDAVHIDEDGIFIAVNGLYEGMTRARLQITTQVRNDGDIPANVNLCHRLLDAQGAEVVRDSVSLRVEPGSGAGAMVLPGIEAPHLWTDKTPYLYTLETTLVQEGRVIDVLSTRTGVRTAAFDCDRGFLLNGKTVKIKGMCVHHDGGLTGTAMYRETWERRLKLLKDMGCNGIRCSHNPPAPELLDLCDELGFLVMDEAFDEWFLCKAKSFGPQDPDQPVYGNSQFFAEEGERDLTAMLRRDRNHPSVILWSIGNEIPEQSAIGGPATLRRLQALCHREDPTRMVTCALDNLAAPESSRTREEFECALDVAGYNYVARWGMRAETLYDEDRRKFPQRRFIGSENPSAGGIRGSYERINMGPFQMGYETLTLNHEFNWRYTASRDFVAGDYLWTGIDYLGETLWPSRGAMGAPIDTAGFVKDTFYYFRSIWNEDKTTLHILPHWNWEGKEGRFITVIGYTNCDEVSLYLNGRLVGTKGYDFPNVGSTGAWNIRAKNTHPTTHDLHLVWDVPYEAGELKAVGYREGKVAAERVVKTTGSPARIRASADRENLPIRGIAHIEVETEDAAGLLVPTADTLVEVRIEGAAALLGMDSGDVRDNTLYTEPARRLFAGKLLCVIRGIAPGSARVIFRAANMGEAALNFTIR
jgi:beta-galactosidase